MNETDIIKRITENEDRSKSNTYRIDKLEQRQNDLDKIVKGIAVVENEVKNIKEDVKETKNDVRELKAKPGKKWEAVVDKVIMVFLGAVLAYILTSVGL